MRRVNLLDLVLLVSLLVALVGGFRLGLVARAAAWAGLIAGLWLATILVPALVRLVPAGDALVRLLVGMLGLVVVVGGLAGVGEGLGLRLRSAVARGPLRPLDRLGGAVAGVAGLLVLVWFLTPAATMVPGFVAQQVRSSSIVQAIDDAAPPPPDALRTLRSLVDQSRFPEVFADLRPAPDTGPPPSEFSVPGAVLDRVTASTVNIESRACGGVYEGSGFAVEPDLVVTNAHVVAGTEDLQVRRPDGSTASAQVVAFDANRDLALVRVPGLGQSPLPLASAEVGSDGAVVGYPGGQDTPRRQPARITDRRPTVGRDIYDRQITERSVLYLASELRQGDSGAPLVDVDGNVTGVVFAVAADRSTTAYALDVSELRTVLAGPRDQAAGPCT